MDTISIASRNQMFCTIKHMWIGYVSLHYFQLCSDCIHKVCFGSLDQSTDICIIYISSAARWNCSFVGSLDHNISLVFFVFYVTWWNVLSVYFESYYRLFDTSAFFFLLSIDMDLDLLLKNDWNWFSLCMHANKLLLHNRKELIAI